MVKIRLHRTGRKNQPAYRVVVIDNRTKRDGRHIEILGSYNPLGKQEVVIDKDRYAYWIGRGAQPTERVAKLVVKAA
ncbi:30S ribosomal protein S16 [candidate division WWE3 bacterium]|nr:30S ribosomal protein S16 [candidate division WWE3 bacterium]